MGKSCVEVIDVPELGPPPTAYGNVNVVDIGTHKLISIAGQIAIRPDGTVPENPWEQFDMCFEKVEKALASVGATIQDVNRLVYYVVDYDESVLPIVMDKVHAFLKGHRPASCFIGVQSLSQAAFKVEIEASAVIKV